jgi:hypothetical protein
MYQPKNDLDLNHDFRDLFDSNDLEIMKILKSSKS